MTKNKNIYIAIGIAAVVLIVFFATKSNVSAPSPEKAGEQNEVKTSGPVNSNSSSKATQTNKTEQKQSTADIATGGSSVSSFPEIDFIDKRLTFELKDFPNIKIIIEKVVFGRRDVANSTGCSGIPNANFSTYLYPGSGICISAETVDGSPRGIVAIHMLVENNGSVGFGGNSDIFRLHYLRSDFAGQPVYRFAYPIMGLGSYYIGEYSSRVVILSYLVPEDQLIFNLVSGYKEPALENKTLNIYDFSANGILIDFGSKVLKVVK